MDDTVGPDFQGLATESWAKFLAVMTARQRCFGDVYLQVTEVLDSRAVYRPDTATVIVRVPGTPALLQGALIHEWAHHVEFQCEAQQEMRAAFLQAQGLPPDTPWQLDDSYHNLPESEWAKIPSEQYAEAMIVVVLGNRQIPTKARVSSAAIAVVERWALGETSK